MYTSTFLIALVTGITEVIKRAFKLNKRYLPLISLILGIGIAFLVQNGFDYTSKETILFGIMIGLSSCGLFSGIKSFIYVAEKLSQKTKR